MPVGEATAVWTDIPRLQVPQIHKTEPPWHKRPLFPPWEFAVGAGGTKGFHRQAHKQASPCSPAPSSFPISCHRSTRLQAQKQTNTEFGFWEAGQSIPGQPGHQSAERAPPPSPSTAPYHLRGKTTLPELSPPPATPPPPPHPPPRQDLASKTGRRLGLQLKCQGSEGRGRGGGGPPNQAGPFSPGALGRQVSNSPPPQAYKERPTDRIYFKEARWSRLLEQS